ncbi:unnamed protein product [Trichobilharzia regenti]|nr:unnamed protein product [Trichobilharzia regenti]
MASVVAKIGTTGLRVGGKVAARQVGKQVAKKAIKQAAKKGAKTAAKKGAKKGSKQTAKKAAKKEAKSSSSKSAKKTTKKLAKKEEEAQSKSGENKKSGKEYRKHTPDKKKEKPKSKSKSPVEKSTSNHSKKDKTSKKHKSETKSHNLLLVNTPADERIEGDTSSQTTSSPSVKEKRSSILKSSSTTPSRSAVSTPTDLRSGSTDGTSVTTTSSDTTETGQSTSASTTSATTSSRLAQMQPKAELDPQTSISRKNSGMFTLPRRVSKSKETTSQLKSPTKPKGNTPENIKNLEQSVTNDVLKEEALKEVKDTEFNLMLLRLAKYLLTDVKEKKEDDDEQKKEEERKTSCEWVEALKLVLDSDAFQKDSRKMKRKHRKKQKYDDEFPEYQCPCSSKSYHEKPDLEDRNYKDHFTPIEQVKRSEENAPVDDEKTTRTDISTQTQLSTSSDSDSYSSNKSSERCENARRLGDIIRLLNKCPPSCCDMKSTRKQSKYQRYRRTSSTEPLIGSRLMNTFPDQSNATKQNFSAPLSNPCYPVIIPTTYYTTQTPFIYEEPAIVTDMLIDLNYPYFSDFYC